MKHTLVPLTLAAIALTGCIVLPFGVHVNRPFPMEDQGRIRLGVGIAQLPEGQGTVDAVNNDGGTAANPVPSGSDTAKFAAITVDATVGVLHSLDFGFGARGVYLLWAPAKAGNWIFSVSPAFGTSSSTANGVLSRTEKETGKLGNLNLLATAAWRMDTEAPEKFFAYGGVADNLYSTTITVTETNPPFSVTGKDHATAPTVLVGVGAKALGTTINAEAAETMLKERTGRTDSVLTVSLLLSWSFNLFHHQAAALTTP